MRSMFVVVIAWLFGVLPAAAAERLVPQQYASIQAAINASVAGDVVTVAPGTYVEGIVFGGKNITVRSSGGAAVTVISPTSIGKRCVQFTGGETNAAVLDGFTLRGGRPITGTLPGHGAGILVCSSSHPTVLNCIVRDGLCELGAGIYTCLNSCTRIGSTTFCNNLATSGYGWDIAQCYEDLGGIVVCAECGCSPGAVVEWPVASGGNGHWYQARLEAPQMSWEAARAAARAAGGDLVTLGSAAEQSVVQSLLRPYSNAFWIGLLQAAGAAEPADGWAWLDGSGVGYRNWEPGQPDNANGNQHYGAMLLSGGWSDWRVDGETFNGRVGIRGFVIEWSADCNLDGLVDYGQIQAGQLADANGNGLPDLCEVPSTDCNSNGRDDSIDINSGASADCDHDHIPDECEKDSDGDAVIDACDGCPSDPNKISPGTCGCGVSDADTDGDGIANCVDECPNDPSNNCNSLTPTVALAAWGAGEFVGTDFPDYGQSVVPSSVRSAVGAAGGWIHSLALQSNGSVVGWGANTNNLGTVVGQATVPAGLGTCSAVSAGFYHSMALRTDGTIACWGDNRYGQSTTPAGIGGALAIAAGGYHSAALRADGTAICWGAGSVNSGTTPDAGQSIVPSGLGACSRIAAGGYHTVAVRANGTVACWGFNLFGQCSTPSGLGACTDVAAGDTHTVALRSDGTVVCWGGGTASTGSFPQFGQSMVPTSLGACTAIAAGGYHTVVIRADGSVAAFGAGATGSSVDPNHGQSVVPAELQEPHAATRIAAGGRHTLVLTTQRPVPSFYPTIQDAIDACNPFDSVVVAAGTYAGPIDFHGKNIVVRGAGAGSSVIAGTGGASSSVVRIVNQQPEGGRLEGFTIRGGLTGSPVPGNESAFVGGGVFMYRSNATIRNCTIEDNGAAFGAGVYLLYCGGAIENCLIRNNSADAYGGGALLFDCTTAVVGSEFRGNSTVTSGGGLHVVQISTSNFAPSITDCTIAQNLSTERAGGIGWDPGQAVLVITGTTITDNVGALGAGGIHIGPSGGAIRTRLVDTDVCGNSAPNVVGSYYSDELSVVCDCPGDVDGNGAVNGIDLAAVLAAWNTNGTAYPGSDVNHDGAVNGQDLAITLSNWGTCR